MNYELIPVLSIRELENVLYDKKKIVVNELRAILFNDQYVNDCYKSLYFADDETIDGWDPDPDDLYEMKVRNSLYEILREEFPNREIIIVDVSW